MVVGVLLMALIGTVTSFFTYLPRWFAVTSVRLDVDREESVATAFLERDLNDAAACSCPSPDVLEIGKTAGLPTTIRYFLAANPTRTSSYELRRSTDGTTTNYFTVARDVSSLTCTPQPAYHGVDVCLVYKRDNATRRARLQWRAVTPRTADVALGDWDRDGRLDAASVRAGSADVEVLKNAPEGSLTVAGTAALAPGSAPLAIVTDDFDRNGRADLAVLTATAVQFLDGTGFTFAVTSTLALPATTAAAHGLAAGDLDRDGIPDLAVSDRPGRRVQVLHGAGDFGFSAPVAWPAAPASLPGVPGRVRLADLNRDGILDVVVGFTEATGASVAIGIGSANRAAPFSAPLLVEAGAQSTDLALGDLNRDGLLDLATADRGQDRVALLGGQIAPPYFGAAGFTATVSPTAVAWLDHNDNGTSAGVPDLAVLSGARHDTAALSVFPGLSTGGLASPAVVTFSTGETDAIALATGNVTRTGHASIVARWMGVDPGGYRTVLAPLQTSTGLVPYADQSLATGTEPQSVVTGDFDRDGFPDLAVARAGAASVAIYLHATGNTTPSFYPASPMMIGTTNRNHGLAAADFNRDGILDLVTTQPTSSRICVLTGTGAPPCFTAGAPFPSGNRPESVCAADFDRDGAPDLVVADVQDHTVRLLHGDGAGGFTTPNAPIALAAIPSGILSADFNRDGRPDLAVSCLDSNDIKVLLGHGDGTFAPPVSYATGAAPHSVASGDLNRDGIPDLASAGSLGGTTAAVSVLLGLPGGFAPFTAHGLGSALPGGNDPHASTLAIADLDRDGYSDIAFGAFSDDASAAGVLLNQGTGTTFAPHAWPADDPADQPAGLTVTDVNRDGRADLVVVYPGTGRTEVRLGY